MVYRLSNDNTDVIDPRRYDAARTDAHMTSVPRATQTIKCCSKTRTLTHPCPPPQSCSAPVQQSARWCLRRREVGSARQGPVSRALLCTLDGAMPAVGRAANDMQHCIPEPTDEAAAADVDQDRSGLHHAQPANGGQMAAQLTAAWVRTLHAARRHSLGAAGA